MRGNALLAFGVDEEHIFVDHGMTGTNRARPGPREAMAVARARGRHTGKQPNLFAVQRKHLLSLYDAGEHTRAEIAELFSVSRTTVYREIQRRGAATKPADGP